MRAIKIVWFHTPYPAFDANVIAQLKGAGVTHVLLTAGQWQADGSLTLWADVNSAVSFMQNNGLSVLLVGLSVWNYQDPINLANSSVAQKMVNSALALVKSSGAAGFCDVTEAWTGTEQNFIDYLNNLGSTLRSNGKKAAMANMHYEGLGWNAALVYSSITLDFVCGEFYADFNNPLNDTQFSEQIHLMLQNAKSPVVIGIAVSALLTQLSRLTEELTSGGYKNKFAGVMVYEGKEISSTNWELIGSWSTPGTEPTPTPQPTLAARTIGPLGVPSALLHKMWLAREKVIRPEVHKKLHPLV